MDVDVDADVGERRVAVVVAVEDEVVDEAAVEAAAVEAALQPPEEVEAEEAIKAAAAGVVVVRALAGNLNQNRRNASRTEKMVER